MRSTVSITLEVDCLLITSSTDGWLLNQPAARLLRTPASIEATDESRTTAPLVLRTMMASYCDARSSCALVPMVMARSLPSNSPTGPTALLLAMAVRTSSMDNPIEASAIGLMRTRIAGCSAPLTLTSATPSTWDRRWAMTVSAAS
jgi:hypothetical protein